MEDQLPFNIKRAFFIYGVDNSVRGGHKHKTTRQAAVCILGKCIVSNNDGQKEEDFILDHPSKCLIIEPYDWHTKHHFSQDAVLLVFANTKFE